MQNIYKMPSLYQVISRSLLLKGYDSSADIFVRILTCIAIARQRLGKHMPAVKTPQQ
jgi:hypothetical protein